MSASLKILLIHQGADLYGSDRSFASSVQAVREKFPEAQIDVILPTEGPLIEIVHPFASRVIFESKGILRKIEIKKAPFRAIFRLFSAAQTYRRLFSDYDICYINTVVCVSAIFALRNHRTPRKFVHVREIPSHLQRRFFRSLLKYSQSEVIYNSEATAKAFGIAGSVIYNGVSKPVFEATHHKEKKSSTRIIIIGRINLWKGQQFVLKALARYGSDIDAHIRIIGDTFPGYEYLLNELRKTASECTQQIDFVGFSKDTAPEIAWSDFVLVPSILPEPFGRVAIESFAVGRPVIASNGGGLCEIVTNDVDGFLFEPSNEQHFIDTLRRAIALTDSEYQQMCSSAEHKYKNKFTEWHYRERVAQVVSRPTEDKIV